MNRVGLDDHLPVPWSVSGSPVGYSFGAAEQEWKAQIKAVVPAAPRTHAGTGLLAGFHVLPPTSRMPGFDLDNLLDPVLSAVINGRGWFGGRRPNLCWVAAQKEVSAAMPGLRLAVLEQVPRLWIAAGAVVGLNGVYRGELPASSAVEEYAAWVRRHMLRRLVRGNVGVGLDFADERVNLGDVATGKAKVLIDGLWPILGGSRGAPDDRRVAALIMRKGITDLRGAVAVNVVGLPEHWPKAACVPM